MEVEMKKIFLVLVVFGVEANCMEKWTAYFSVTHNGIEEGIIAKVAPNGNNIKLLGHMFEEEDQLDLTEEEDSLEVAISNANTGTIEICSSENTQNHLLSFLVQKTGKHVPATVNFIDVSRGIMAVLYRPSMGGGDNFVLAFGRRESDVAVSTVQQAQRLGHLQMYFPVCSMVGDD
jgi:hypothetical protein